ncbi:MraY family glycosyltransferase, partial [Duncaniella freteri]
MAYWIINSLIVFALCVLLAGVLIPQILLIAYRRKLFDEVDERKIHKGLIPRLGGIAFVPVILLSIALTIAANIISGSPQFGNVFFNNSLLMIALFCSLQLLYLVGIADDLIGIKYRAKFVVQIVCAVLLISAGCWFTTLAGSLGIENMPSWMGMPFTAIVIVFIINAMNLIDGIDGLASGLSSIATGIYGISFLLLGEYAYAIISLA